MKKTTIFNLVLAGALTGGMFSCAGSSDGDGIDDKDTAALAEMAYLVDDFDDGNDANIGDHGAWYVYPEETKDVKIKPTENGEFSEGLIRIDADNPGPAALTDNVRYFHFQGSGISEWGASAHLDLLNDESGECPLPIDLSEYKGIQFYAKGDCTLRATADTLQLSDQHTCTPAAECGNMYGSNVKLTGEWRLYQLPFSAMAQEDWGLTKKFDAKSIIGITFTYVFDESGNSPTFAFDIDHVGFYSGPAFDPSKSDPESSDALACGSVPVDSDTSADSETGADTENGADTETGADTDTGVDTETAVDTDTGADTATDTQ
jgi:hypothetical protein